MHHISPRHAPHLTTPRHATHHTTPHHTPHKATKPQPTPRTTPHHASSLFMAVAAPALAGALLPRPPRQSSQSPPSSRCVRGAQSFRLPPSVPPPLRQQRAPQPYSLALHAPARSAALLLAGFLPARSFVVAPIAQWEPSSSSSPPPRALSSFTEFADESAPPPKWEGNSSSSKLRALSRFAEFAAVATS
ncbi:unnamed protein product [Closterium sp. NIES-54]